MARGDELSCTFVVMSFATAILMVVTQLQGFSSDTSLDDVIETQTAFTAIEFPSSRSSDSPPTADSSRLVVDLSDRQVYLYHYDELQTSYIIAIGQEGWETPTGTFKVLNMQVNPTWKHPFTGEIVPPGPDNPLGSRWIGFWTDGKNEIGLHGTNQPDLLGQAVSHGCIRMRDEEVQVLYTQVTMGTTVSIQE